MANTGTSTRPSLYRPSQEILDRYQFTTLKSLSYDRTRNPFSFGSGGCADVFPGELILEGQTIKVAIKTIRAVHCPGNQNMLKVLCRRIKREELHLRKATTVWHENIIPFYGVSDWNTVEIHPAPGLVSLFCDYNNVSIYLSEHSKEVTKEKKLAFVKDVAFGLAHLHNMDMIHGDLKPNNVLVKDNLRAAICDFGQARVLNFETGHTTNLNGTKQYIAPELLANEPPPSDDDSDDNSDEDSDDSHSHTGRMTTAKGDIYAFAMTALEIASGQVPYKGNQAQQVKKIVDGVKPDLQHRHKKLGEIPGLTEIITKCWATDPKERPGCIKDVVEELVKLN